MHVIIVRQASDRGLALPRRTARIGVHDPCLLIDQPVIVVGAGRPVREQCRGFGVPPGQEQMLDLGGPEIAVPRRQPHGFVDARIRFLDAVGVTELLEQPEPCHRPGGFPVAHGLHVRNCFAPPAGVAQYEGQVELGDAVVRVDRQQASTAPFHLRPSPVVWPQQQQGQARVRIIAVELDRSLRGRLCKGGNARRARTVFGHQKYPVTPRQRTRCVGIVRIDLDSLSEIGNGLLVLV